MSIQKTITTGFLSGAFLVCQSQGVTIASEDFSYADGNLVPNGGWEGHSGSAEFIVVTGGAAQFSHGGGSREDANFTFAPQTSGVLKATFDLTVNDDAPITGTDFEYFVHFMERGDFNFRSRVDIVAPSAGGDYSLGISSGSSTAEATLVNDFNYGDTVSVELAFDLADGTGSLTVNGETITGSASGGGETLDAFALRQSNSSSDETITIDNIVIDGQAAVPEPSTALLGGLGLLALIRRRR